MKTIQNRLAPCAMALLALASGCVGVERSYPDKRYFVLEVSRGGNPGSAKGNSVLQVATMRISPRYEGRSFVYRRTESNFESDFYNEFLVSPAALVTEEVRRELARAQIFQHVVAASSPLEPTHILEGAVNALYGDFRDASSPRAVLEMEFFLSKESATRAEILAQKRYFKSVTISGRTPEALVRGWDEALEAILIALVADLKTIN